MKVHAPRFELDECNSDAEREFIESLHSRAIAAGWHAYARQREDRVVVTIELIDREFNCCLCTLRVDFDGSVMLAGPDETGQLVTDLDVVRDDVVSACDQAPPALANAAADWLEREMIRPIERWEWNRPQFHHHLWRYADTGEELVWGDSENLKRPNLGSPDRVIPVTMYCPSCGTQNLPTDMPCRQCGESLVGETVGGSERFRKAARAVDMRKYGRIGAFAGFAITFALCKTELSSLYLSESETYIAATAAAIAFGAACRFIASRKI